MIGGCAAALVVLMGLVFFGRGGGDGPGEPTPSRGEELVTVLPSEGEPRPADLEGRAPLAPTTGARASPASARGPGRPRPQSGRAASAQRAEVARRPLAPATPAPVEFTPGALAPELVEKVRSIVLAHFRTRVRNGLLGVITGQPGAKIDVTVDGQLYRAVVYRQFSIWVLRPGELSLDEFYLTTTGAWPLSDEVTLPPDVYILYEEGICQALDRPTLEAIARARQAAVTETVAAIEEALSKNERDRARKLLAEARAQHPRSQLLTKLAAAVDGREPIVILTVVNKGHWKLGFRLAREGRVVVDTLVAPQQSVRVTVKRGTYTGTWIGPNDVRGEHVAISRSETWAFRMVPKPPVPGYPEVIGWKREVAKPGMAR